MKQFIIKLILKYKTFVKFLISGSIAAGVDFLFIFIFFDVVKLRLEFSVALAFVLAFGVSFSLQKFWTFKDNSKKVGKQAVLYFSVALFNLFLNTFAVKFLVEKMHLWIYIAQAIVAFCIGMCNFIISRYFIFKIQHKDLKKKELFITKTFDKKRILLATGIYPPDIGGPSTYTKTLLEEFSKLGHRVRVVSYADDTNPGNKRIFLISRKQNAFKRYFEYFYTVYKIAVWADIVYIQGPVSEGLPASLACIVRRKKYVMKIVGDYAWEQGKQRFGVKDLMDDFQTKKYSRKVELLRKIEHYTTQKASKIITPSDYLKSIVKQWGVDEKNIKVVYNSIKELRDLKSKEKLREKYKISNKTILSISRLVEWKGFDTLIELMPEILKIDPEYRLLIIGDGPDKDKLQKAIEKVNLGDKVKLLPRVDHDTVLNYLKACDLFILNTGYEGLSHLIIEAMQVGIPVLTSNIGGNPELIQNNETGILFEYNNRESILNAIKASKDTENVNKMIKNSQNLVKEKFSKAEMIKKIEKELCS